MFYFSRCWLLLLLHLSNRIRKQSLAGSSALGASLRSREPVAVLLQETILKESSSTTTPATWRIRAFTQLIVLHSPRGSTPAQWKKRLPPMIPTTPTSELTQSMRRRGPSLTTLKGHCLPVRSEPIKSGTSSFKAIAPSTILLRMAKVAYTLAKKMPYAASYGNGLNPSSLIPTYLKKTVIS